MKNYNIEVTQVDTYTKTFRIEANSEIEAKSIVQGMIENTPLDSAKKTFDGTRIEVHIKPETLRVHTVESLFDIDKTECDKEVILLEDLTDEQKTYLNLQ